MFVAQRELKVVSKGENPVTKIYRPGEEILDFELWDIHAKRAHLNLEWVTEVDAQPKAETKKAKITKPKKTPMEKIHCGQCEKTFATARAAKIHAKMAHK